MIKNCPEGMIELKTERGVYRVRANQADLLVEIQTGKYRPPKIAKPKRCGCPHPMHRVWEPTHSTLNPDYVIAVCNNWQCGGKFIMKKEEEE